ncbi:MAG: hypothetical protein FJX47_06390 [Alphaproteobacteria bacterium]|nr:hypothetical protein [Alphaproteobacteria bacterium]
MAIVAISIVQRFTTLGDMAAYANENPELYSSRAGGLTTSTGMVIFFGYQLGRLVGHNHYVVAIMYQMVAFVGVVALLQAVGKRDRLLLYLLFCAPSFTLWSSIPSKEGFVVLFVCLILRGFARGLEQKAIVTPVFVIAFAMLAVFKIQYLAAVLFLFVPLALGRYIGGRELLILIGGLFSIAVLVVARDFVSSMALLQIQPHMIGDNARSTRELFFVEHGDVFGKMAEGMLLTFIGPTFKEATISIVHLATFTESVVLLVAISLILVHRLPSMPLFSFLLVGFAVFWTIVANYPLGVMNPGTAIRYRTGWIPIIFFSVAILTSRSVYERWIGLVRRPRKAPIAGAPATQST